jgi:hypothetical protein
MKQAVVIVAVVFSLVLSGCGGMNSSNSGNINGNWTATLNNSSGAPTLAFTTSFTQGSGSNLNVVNFSFTTSGQCFADRSVTETGSFGLSGNFNGQVSGSFGMTIAATGGSDDGTLTLDGTVSNGRITGTWTLTGTATGCTGNGSFTMSPG